jgi:hypothetical protein
MGSMLSSISCPTVQSLHDLLYGMSSFSQASLDERRNNSCTVYHVWLSNLGMAEMVRPDQPALDHVSVHNNDWLMLVP